MAVGDVPSSADLQREVARLERELADARRQRDEGLAREAATGAVLRAIATSSADLQSVLDTIAESAARVPPEAQATMMREMMATLREIGENPQFRAASAARERTPPRPVDEARIARLRARAAAGPDTEG